MFTRAPIVWSRANLIRMLVLLVRVWVCAGGVDFRFDEDVGFSGTEVGNASSRKDCQTMLGGLDRMLKRAKRKTCVKSREKDVCLRLEKINFGSLSACGEEDRYAHRLDMRIWPARAHWTLC